MVYVYLQQYRRDFLEYIQTHLFEYREVFDLSVEDIAEGDVLILDTLDVPDNLACKLISYKFKIESGKSIKSFDELTKFIGVLPVGTPSCVIPENTIRVTLDDAYYAQHEGIPDPSFQGINLLQQTDDIVIRPPEISAKVAPHISTLSHNPGQFQDVDYTSISFPEPQAVPHPVVESPSVMAGEMYYPASAQVNSFERQPQLSNYPAQPARVPTTAGGFIPDQQFEQGMAVKPAYNSLADVRGRPTSIARGSINEALQLRRHAGINPNMATVLFGVTPDCGTTTLSYMLALRMAELFPEKQICLIDLDVVKPDLTEMLMRIGGLNPKTDANLMNLAQLGVEDWLENQQFLTTEICVDESRFNFIGHTTTGFADKRRLASYDYSQKLDMLRDAYDCVIVDGGRIQATTDYQLILLPSGHKKIIVADGTTRSTMLAFLRDISGINVDYTIVANKLSRNLSPVAIERQLAREVCATFPIKNSLEPFILNGNSVASLEDTVYLRNLQQVIEGVIL